MDPAGAVRVVENKDVAVEDPTGVLAQNVMHCGWKRPQVDDDRQALGDHLAVSVTEGRRIVQGILDYPGVSRPHHRQRHLVDDRTQTILNDLEGDRVNVSRHFIASITILPNSSSQARSSGDTTTVASYSSTMNGPGRSDASSSLRLTIGVLSVP